VIEPDWEIAPKTVEALICALAAQSMWEATHRRSAPREAHIILTSRVMAEVAARILVLEEKVAALEEGISE
jgi:hypothetical protein